MMLRMVGWFEDPPRAWAKTSNLASLIKKPKKRITSLVKQWRGDRTICGRNSSNYGGENENWRPERSRGPTNIERTGLRVVWFLSTYYQGAQVKRLLFEGGMHETYTSRRFGGGYWFACCRVTRFCASF